MPVGVHVFGEYHTWLLMLVGVLVSGENHACRSRSLVFHLWSFMPVRVPNDSYFGKYWASVESGCDITTKLDFYIP